MKNTINISIRNPCFENYNDFEKTSLGGFCNTYIKEIIDFTKMSNKEVFNFFKTNPKIFVVNFIQTNLKLIKKLKTR